MGTVLHLLPLVVVPMGGMEVEAVKVHVEFVILEEMVIWES